jgi:H+/gluconate symporter-like permease
VNLNAWLRLIAGAFIMSSVFLGYAVSPWFYLFTAFVGLNLFQSALTGWCPMITLLRKAGVPEA